MTPILSSNLSVLKASGRSDLYMRTEIIRRAIMLAILGIAIIVPVSAVIFPLIDLSRKHPVDVIKSV